MENAHILYRYLGPGYMMCVPARDLTAADILEVVEREGITLEEIEASGLYEAVSLVEVQPFCGAPTRDGGRCRRWVAQWGEYCYQHQEVDQ